MTSYTFKWPHATTDEVYVTGTFDNWSKSVKLEKVGDVLEKTVELPDSAEKIHYKFVVGGDWKVDESAPIEDDGKGTVNNVLTPEDIIKSTPAFAAITNSAASESTTAELAKDVPLETPNDVPGGFPETPADELNKEVKVAPLPAAEGALNPIKLAPGEPIPESITAQSTTSHVKLDPESYEKADTIPGLVTELPPVTSNMIPESSLPIRGANEQVHINSAGPNSTTAGLAADVPLEEPKVPEVVKESQEKAGVEPAASGMSTEVNEKEKVEDELKSTVPEAPSTSEGTAGKGTEKSENDKTLAQTVTAAVSGLGAAALATAWGAKETVTEQASAAGTQATAAATDAAKQLPESVKENVPDAVKDALPAPVQDALSKPAAEEVREEVAPTVPTEVKQSIAEAGKSPEAAASTSAVEDKKAVEQELLKEVKPAAAAGEKSDKAELNGTSAANTAAAATTSTTGATADASKTTETPTVATGATTETAATKATPATPETKKPAESAASTAERKKKNRISSMLGKIKNKMSSKDKA